MKVLCLKYFQHISKIIQIMNPTVITNNKSINSQKNIQSKNDQEIEELLKSEIVSLKSNIQNLIKYCQSLENQNKMLKNSYSFSNYIQERNSYAIHSNLNLYEKNTLAQNPYLLKSTPQFTLKCQKQNELLKRSKESYFGSLNKIHNLKNQVADLTQKLNDMTKTYQKHELDDTDDSLKKDMLFNQQSLIPYGSKQYSDKYQAVDLEYLLCHQQLSMEETAEKQNIFTNSNNDQVFVDSLIAKGISFRQAKTLRSPQFQELNSLIQKYRQQSRCHSKQTNLKRYKSITSR